MFYHYQTYTPYINLLNLHLYVFNYIIDLKLWLLEGIIHQNLLRIADLIRLKKLCSNMIWRIIWKWRKDKNAYATWIYRCLRHFTVANRSVLRSSSLINLIRSIELNWIILWIGVVIRDVFWVVYAEGNHIKERRSLCYLKVCLFIFLMHDVQLFALTLFTSSNLR